MYGVDGAKRSFKRAWIPVWMRDDDDSVMEEMQTDWKVSRADNRLIQLLEAVDEEGPREIEHRGRVYLVSPLGHETPERNRLVEIITSGPSGHDLVPGGMRNVEL